MRTIISTCLLLMSFAPAFSQLSFKGKIIDQYSREPLEDAVITEGKSGRKALSDQQGHFEITVSKTTDSLYISYVGYQPQVLAVGELPHQSVIALVRGQVDLKAVTVTPPTGASFHTLSRLDLSLRPVNSAQDLMRLVPGLFLGQHQGGGIAEHIFFRGFDADHGTDVNVSVDGMPVNLVSQAHGQGFADLHFLIPELVSEYEYGKGPYYTRYGDFTTAGYVAFHTYDVLKTNEVKLEGGQFHTGRLMAMANLLGKKAREKGESAWLAGEAAYTDGAFDLPQHLSRLNLYGKYRVRLSPATRLKLTVSTFSSGWQSSGEIPERAVSQGMIGRFGYIDSAQGGYTSRTNVLLQLSSSLSDRLLWENQVYYTRYFFNLHYDPTFFADDSINGDQHRQRESRDLFGYDGRLVHHAYFQNGADLSSSFGAGWQLNRIYNSELSHTVNYNTVLEYIQFGDITESSGHAYVNENYQVGKWMLNAGLRADYLHFYYADKLNPPQAARGKLLLSPKINIAYTASDKVQLYLKTGKGFHSNDAKVVASRQGVDILPAAYGADLGLNWKPFPKLYLNAALWWLYLQQEFVYDADEGTFEPGDPTRREGADLSFRYELASWLYANFDLNICRARDTRAPKGSDYLPLAVPLSGTGGLEFKGRKGFNGALSYRYMKDRPANEDNSLIAKGYFVTDLTASYTCHKYEIGLEIQNLFNVKWREAQFEVESRMRNEAMPVDGMSFTPGTPFFAKLKCAVFF